MAVHGIKGRVMKRYKIVIRHHTRMDIMVHLLNRNRNELKLFEETKNQEIKLQQIKIDHQSFKSSCTNILPRILVGSN